MNTGLDAIIQTGGTLAVLAFFLMYFMKEQKEVRGKMEALQVKHENDMNQMRTHYDEKVEAMMQRIDEINMKSLTALGDVKTSNDRLTEAVNSLTEKLHK